MDALLAKALESAILRGELPPTTDTALATRLLKGLFYGLPLATRGERVSAIRPAYEAGLTLLLPAFARPPRISSGT